MADGLRPERSYVSLSVCRPLLPLPAAPRHYGPGSGPLRASRHEPWAKSALIHSCPKGNGRRRAIPLASAPHPRPDRNGPAAPHYAPLAHCCGAPASLQWHRSRLRLDPWGRPDRDHVCWTRSGTESAIKLTTLTIVSPDVPRCVQPGVARHNGWAAASG